MTLWRGGLAVRLVRISRYIMFRSLSTTPACRCSSLEVTIHRWTRPDRLSCGTSTDVPSIFGLWQDSNVPVVKAV